MFNILICDDIAQEGIDIFNREKIFNIIIKTKLSIKELKSQICNVDGCIVRSQTRITKDVIEAAKKLKVIGRAGVGCDNIDMDAASEKGIVIINTPNSSTIAAAEHTFALLLALARNIPIADASIKMGKWERKDFMGIELHNKTLGIIGLGRIGKEVAIRALGFGMHVLAYDPLVKGCDIMDVKLTTLDDLLAHSDMITLHMPLMPNNNYELGTAELAKTKKGVLIINCARGGLIDETALAKAIQSGWVAGAALDVFEHEPPQDSLLFHLPSVILTPHLGGSTKEAQIAVSVDIAQSIVDYLQKSVY